MKTTLKLPRISMNMVEATISSWRKQVGDEVKEGEVLYEIETEKATSEIPSPATGRLVEILVETGADLQVGDPVCRLEI